MKLLKVCFLCLCLGCNQKQPEPEPLPDKWDIFDSIEIGKTNWSKLNPPLWHCFRVGESDVAKAYHESGVVATFIWDNEKRGWILQEKDVR
jgi:hypothetical protein